jgi:predicted component of type VI protein secretion system
MQALDETSSYIGVIALFQNNPNNTKSSHNGNSDRREFGLWVIYDGFMFSV